VTGQGTGYCFGLHLWSLLTALATIPLLLAGGTVTTMRWGMVDDYLADFALVLAG
jgi:hypothetical protein